MTKQQDSSFNDQTISETSNKNLANPNLSNLDYVVEPYLNDFLNNLIIVYLYPKSHSYHINSFIDCCKKLSETQFKQIFQFEKDNQTLKTKILSPDGQESFVASSYLTIHFNRIINVIAQVNSGYRISNSHKEKIMIIIDIFRNINNNLYTLSNNNDLIQHNNKSSLDQQNSNQYTTFPVFSSEQVGQSKEKPASEPSNQSLVKSSKKIYYLFGGGFILMSLFIIDDKYHNNKILYSLLGFTSHIPSACKKFFRPVALHAVQAFHEIRQR